MNKLEKTRRQEKINQILTNDYNNACFSGNSPSISNETSAEMSKIADNEELTPEEFDKKISDYEYYA